MRAVTKGQGLQVKKIALNLTKILLFTYILTGLLLFLLAFLMYKLDLASNQINLGVILIMVLATFIGGMIAGKTFREKRFLYGAVVGLSYFLILLIISLLLNKNNQLAQETLTMFLMCIGGGTLGGMLG